MKVQQIKQPISNGEGVKVEFKESHNFLSRSVFQTVCAFLNRKGGHILLGVKDDKSIIGVREDTIQSELDILAKDMNNPQIISPTFFLSPLSESFFNPISYFFNQILGGSFNPQTPIS